MLSTHELDRLRKIISKTGVDGNEWLRHRNIWIGDKGDYYVLNYGPGPRNDCNQLVRGMIVAKGESKDPLERIRSFPFVRFYNQGEKDAAPVDLNNAEMIEKLDGTMVGVFFVKGELLWHTRRMICTHEKDMEMVITGFHGKPYKYLALIGEFVKALNWDYRQNYTYVFEFIHEASFVWTKYQPEQYGLYLLGARDLDSYVELSEEELDNVAVNLGAKRPRRWAASTEADYIVNMIEEVKKTTPDFEGFVFRDKNTGHRMKVKDPEYVKYHHMLDKTSYKYLVPIVMADEQEEVLAYFPFLKDKVETLSRKMEAYTQNVIEKSIHWKNVAKWNKWHRKILWSEIARLRLDKFCIGQIMNNHELDDDDLISSNVRQAIEKLAMGDGKKMGAQPKRIIDLIGLEDDEPTDDKVEIGEL